MLFEDYLFDLMTFLQSLTHLNQAGRQKILSVKQAPSNLGLLINKTLCIRKHPLVTDFLIYRILDHK